MPSNYLIILEPGGIKKRFPLQNKTVFVGRSSSCAISVQDNAFSRQHLKISFDPATETYFIEDLKSSNGSSLNDSPLIEITMLKTGDRIKVGDTQILFVEVQQPPPDTTNINPFLSSSKEQDPNPNSKPNTQSKGQPLGTAIREVFLKERYQVLQTLGKGGMGVVQRVQDKWLGREVALKRIRIAGGKTSNVAKRQQQMLFRFRKEASITAVLEHPNIVPLHDIQKISNGNLYFTMRKIEGSTLTSILEQKRSGSTIYDEDKILSIYFKVCDAVAYAHSKKVIHRDLKPDNIMVGKFGEVYVLDWGIAKQLEKDASIEPDIPPLDPNFLKNYQETVYQTVGGLGTPGYMPPEQAMNANAVRPQADIYALGVMLKQCFTLRSPYEEFQQEMLSNQKILTGDSKKKDKKEEEHDADLSEDILAIVQKATEDEWYKRYESVQMLVDDIQRYSRNIQISIRKYSFRELCVKWFERNKKFLILTGLFVSLWFFLFGYFRFSQYKEKQNRFYDAYQAVFEEKEKADREQNGTPTINRLLSILNLVNKALSIDPEHKEMQEEKYFVAQKLIDLCCQKQNYQMAHYVLKDLERLITFTETDKKTFEEKLTTEKNKTLKQHQQILDVWISLFTTSILDKKKQERAIVEISRMREKTIVEKLTQLVYEGVDYFVKDQKIDPRKDEFYQVMVRGLGRQGNPETSSLLLNSLTQLTNKLATVPQGNRSLRELNYAVALSEALGNTKKQGLAHLFQNVRVKLGEHSLFWDRTTFAYHKLLMAEKKKMESQSINTYPPNSPEEKVYQGIAAKEQGNLQNALDLFSQALALNPKYAFAYYQRGLIYSNQKQFEKALQDYDQSLKYNPYFSKAYYQRGTVQKERNQIEKALTNYSEAIRLSPRSHSLYFSRGLLLQQKGDLDQALRDFKEVLSLVPNQTKAWFHCGQIEEIKENSTQALSYYSQAIQQDPQFVEAYFRRAHLQGEKKEFEKALSDLTQILLLQPKNQTASLWRARFLVEMGDSQKAVTEYTKILQSNPNSAELYLARAYLWKKLNKPQKLTLDFQKALQLEPQNSKVHFQYGVFLIEQKKEKEALERFNQAIQLNPKYEKAYVERAKLFYKMNQFSNSLKDYNQALLLNPNQISLYKIRGKILQKQGKFSEAENDFEKALSFKPNDLELYLFLGNLKLQQKKFDYAQRDFEKVIEQDPQNTGAFLGLGEVYRLKGDFKKSLAYYNQLIQIRSNTAYFYLQRGRVRMEAHNLEEAEQDFQKCFRLNPNLALAHYYNGLLHERLKKKEIALKQYSQAIRINATHAPSFLRRGLLLKTKGKAFLSTAQDRETLFKGKTFYREALSDLQKAEEFGESSVELYLNQGQILEVLGSYSEALQVFEKAIAHGSKDPLIHFYRGAIYYRLKKRENAYTELAKALKNGVKHPRAYAFRGILRIRKDEIEAAIRDLDKARREKANLAEVHAYRGFAKTRLLSAYGLQASSEQTQKFLLQEKSSAFFDLKIALEMDPKCAIAYCLRGVLKMEEAKVSEALQDFNKAIQLDPKLAEPYIYRGIAHYYNGNFSKARLDCENGVKYAPEYFLAYYHRGLIRRATSQYKEAISDFYQCLTLLPSFKMPYQFLEKKEKLSKRALKQQIQEHLKTLEENRQKHPQKNVEVFVDRAQLRTHLKEWKEALSDLDDFFYWYPAFQKYYVSPIATIPKPPTVKGFEWKKSTFYKQGRIIHKIHEYLHTQTGLEFSLIPGGFYKMGSMATEIEHSYRSSEAIRILTVKSFLCSKTEVHQKAWKQIMKETGMDLRKGLVFKDDFRAPVGDNFPVYGAARTSIQTFCQRTKLSLLSEAKWEYACRGGTKTTFYWGNDLDPKFGVFDTGAMAEVQSKHPNTFGLYDMSGNVAEWCADNHISFDSRKFPKDDRIISDKRSRFFVIRGGHFGEDGDTKLLYSLGRSAARNRILGPKSNLKKKILVNKDFRNYTIGFRVCKFLSK